ncbi:MAG: hypothetical protein ACLQIS_00840 [Bryobacteraceae bacterium]
MNALNLAAVSVATAFAVVLPAQAADSHLLNLVMPDAVVVSGANVAQAETSPFGQYVLAQIQSQDAGLQKLIAATGFDPTQDVSETLAASNGTPQTGLLLARGTFDAAKFALPPLPPLRTTPCSKPTAESPSSKIPSRPSDSPSPAPALRWRATWRT